MGQSTKTRQSLNDRIKAAKSVAGINRILNAAAKKKGSNTWQSLNRGTQRIAAMRIAELTAAGKLSSKN